MSSVVTTHSMSLCYWASGGHTHQAVLRGSCDHFIVNTDLLWNPFVKDVRYGNPTRLLGRLLLFLPAWYLEFSQKEMFVVISSCLPACWRFRLLLLYSWSTPALLLTSPPFTALQIPQCQQHRDDDRQKRLKQWEARLRVQGSLLPPVGVSISPTVSWEMRSEYVIEEIELTNVHLEMNICQFQVLIPTPPLSQP